MTTITIPGMPNTQINEPMLTNLTNEELARLLEPSTDPVIREILRRWDFTLDQKFDGSEF